MKKIIIVGGGTLGHIYPIIPVVERIKDKYKLYFIGTKTGLEKSIIENNFNFKKTFFLDMQGFKRNISFYNLKTIIKYVRCFQEAKKILLKINPHLIIGMGGYISGVVVKAAKKLHFKAIIHEQNSIMGLANKFVERKVDAIFLNFPLQKRINNKNVVIVGNPRLSQIYQKNRIRNERKKYLVVVGGSRGSKVINDLIISSLQELNDYTIVLITGKRYYQENSKKILKLQSEKINIIPFTNSLISYLRKASVVISRCGATTLAEIIALRKIAILIPSPNVTKNHQEENANILVNNNCAVKILEKDLSKKRLVNEINYLENNYDLRLLFRINMLKNFNFNACDEFIKEMEKYL